MAGRRWALVGRRGVGVAPGVVWVVGAGVSGGEG